MSLSPPYSGGVGLFFPPGSVDLQEVIRQSKSASSSSSPSSSSSVSHVSTSLSLSTPTNIMHIIVQRGLPLPPNTLTRTYQYAEKEKEECINKETCISRTQVGIVAAFEEVNSGQTVCTHCGTIQFDLNLDHDPTISSKTADEERTYESHMRVENKAAPMDSEKKLAKIHFDSVRSTRAAIKHTLAGLEEDALRLAQADLIFQKPRRSEADAHAEITSYRAQVKQWVNIKHTNKSMRPLSLDVNDDDMDPETRLRAIAIEIEQDTIDERIREADKEETSARLHVIHIENEQTAYKEKLTAARLKHLNAREHLIAVSDIDLLCGEVDSDCIRRGRPVVEGFRSNRVSHMKDNSLSQMRALEPCVSMTVKEIRCLLLDNAALRASIKEETESLFGEVASIAFNVHWRGHPVTNAWLNRSLHLAGDKKIRIRREGKQMTHTLLHIMDAILLASLETECPVSWKREDTTAMFLQYVRERVDDSKLLAIMKGIHARKTNPAVWVDLINASEIIKTRDDKLVVLYAVHYMKSVLMTTTLDTLTRNQIDKLCGTFFRHGQLIQSTHDKPPRTVESIAAAVVRFLVDDLEVQWDPQTHGAHEQFYKEKPFKNVVDCKRPRRAEDKGSVVIFKAAVFVFYSNAEAKSISECFRELQDEKASYERGLKRKANHADPDDAPPPTRIARYEF